MAHFLTLSRALLVSSVLTVAAALVPGAAPSAHADRIEAVAWSVDKASQTIKVEVHLAFFTGATSRPAQQESINERIAFITRSILKTWDGQAFKCYTLRVSLVTRLVNGSSEVGANEVGIELDAGIYPIGDTLVIEATKTVGVRRSYVSVGTASSDYLSEDPATAGHPNTGPAQSHSTWFLLASGTTYAHEFGHILGLDDAYVEGTWGPKPGAANDLMAGRAYIDPTTMTRVIRRAGIDDKNLHCPLSWDMPMGHPISILLAAKFGVAIHGWTCDYDPPSNAPGARPLMTFQGDAAFEAAHQDPITGGFSGASTEHFTATYPVGDPVARIVFSTGLVLSQPVKYLSKGLFSTDTAKLVSPKGPVEIYVSSVFTRGAKECS